MHLDPTLLSREESAAVEASFALLVPELAEELLKINDRLPREFDRIHGGFERVLNERCQFLGYEDFMHWSALCNVEGLVQGKDNANARNLKSPVLTETTLEKLEQKAKQHHGRLRANAEAMNKIGEELLERYRASKGSPLWKRAEILVEYEKRCEDIYAFRSNFGQNISFEEFAHVRENGIDSQATLDFLEGLIERDITRNRIILESDIPMQPNNGIGGTTLTSAGFIGMNIPAMMLYATEDFALAPDLGNPDDRRKMARKIAPLVTHEFGHLASTSQKRSSVERGLPFEEVDAIRRRVIAGIRAEERRTGYRQIPSRQPLLGDNDNYYQLNPAEFYCELLRVMTSADQSTLEHMRLNFERIGCGDAFEKIKEAMSVD